MAPIPTTIILGSASGDLVNHGDTRQPPDLSLGSFLGPYLIPDLR